MTENILQYESTIWNTADLLRGLSIKESEWPSYMMPFFALMLIESRLLRLYDALKADLGVETLAELPPEDLMTLTQDMGQGYNSYIFEQNKTLSDICQNDKAFTADFDDYLAAFDSETRTLLGVDATDGESFLNMRGIVNLLKAKRTLFSYAKEWSEVDLKPFNNSQVTDLEEHIKRRWADISAETAGEQFTPDDVIALISEIVAAKISAGETLLKIYDCTCGGGNLLFGVEDRIKDRTNRMTQTFGQDQNDTLYALAKIESRFRTDSHIERGNTLTKDQFDDDEFDIVVANPPYGVSWKGYEGDIKQDQTGRFKFRPSISDGQLLFMQHLISKMAPTGIGVVVHNGSTLFSGDAGSAESNIRKWMLDQDLVEAIIQLPTDEFFNTGIHTYLWVLNKQKPADRQDQVMLINASEKFKPLKKSRGSKRKEVDAASRQEIVAALSQFADNDFARVFAKEFFYFNKQAIQLTNLDIHGHSFAEQLDEAEKGRRKLTPLKLDNGERALTQFVITSYDKERYHSLLDYLASDLKPFISGLDYKEQPLTIETAEGCHHYDAEQESLIQSVNGRESPLGCGKIVVKVSYKKKTKTRPQRIEITVELTPDYQKDYEIIPYHRDEAKNQAAIDAFMARYITKPFVLLENVVGVEINFNKIFYSPKILRDVSEIMADIADVERELQTLEQLFMDN